ncbi:unnamed protein product [Acanthoscelides obtectus]|uniref:Uncharacterized protein n=1 Tax=Acanthoscelides obtectus TaxID=200917 RepID=A0A9P0PAT4_ACAOB|nr:unnamed protein product [Acanthoscelides obtectus]CAK1666672.1 Adhesion G-protein coupled receptor G6 [Acanthoscelides obtectus]
MIYMERCYCIRRNKCENTTIIASPYDQDILMKMLGNRECYVGDSKLDGFRSSIGKNGWRYTRNSLPCTICTVRSLQVDTKMILYFDESHRSLSLTVYHPEGIFRNQYDMIYCYTDATKALKSRVSIKRVFQDDRHVPFAVYELKLEKYMGMYWCEAFKIGTTGEVVKSNSVIAYKKKEGNEYALKIFVNETCTGCTMDKDVEDLIPDEIPKIFRHIRCELRVMKVHLYPNGTMDLLLHISTGRRREIIKEYYDLRDKLYSKRRSKVTVISFKSAEYCLPSSSWAGKKLTWPLTKIDETKLPDEPCLLSNGLPNSRTCKGSFIEGADWGESSEFCTESILPSPAAEYMRSIIEQNITNEVLNNITDIMTEDNDIGVLGVYYVAQVLKKVSEENSSLAKQVADLTDGLMSVNSTYLKAAQEHMNVTDDVLDAVETIFVQADTRQLVAEVDISEVVDPKMFIYQMNNFITYKTIPLESNVTGIILYGNARNNNFTVGTILRNQSFDDIIYEESLILATYVPDDIITDIERTGSNFSLIITIFLNDTLFVKTNESDTRKPFGPVINVAIPEYTSYLASPIPILFKSTDTNVAPECAFWDYGKKTRRRKGVWSNLGGTINTFENSSDFHICYFSHLTHFALLIASKTEVDHTITNTTEYNLETINLVADVFTTIGLLGIFLTAIIFQNWRSKPGTKILLNICFAITLEISMMVLSNWKSLVKSDTGCKMFGFLLHYAVLSKFTWLLVYAILQYIRFVRVLGPYPSNILLKACILGWGFPLIPTVATYVSLSGTYSINHFGYCYPQNLSLFIGVLLPIVVIILVNFVIFCKVMYEVFHSNIETNNSKMKDSCRLQIQLATLLFFVLGVPTVFILVANWITVRWLRVALIYIYSITSNLEGFILFLFYVVFNGETRRRWRQYYNTKIRRRSLTIQTNTNSSKVS